ncbi:hypothetical protein ACU8V7_02470 [Zobellia nedashkovskayae]
MEALGDYVKLVTEKSNHIVLSSMKNFEKKITRFPICPYS